MARSSSGPSQTASVRAETRVRRASGAPAVTPAALQDTFKKYFPLDRYTVVTLLPES